MTGADRRRAPARTDRKNLAAQLPRNRDDIESAKALAQIGYPAIEPLARQMIDWLKSNGSPVEMVMREFFVVAQEHALPAVRHALRSRHDLLRHSVVANVIAKWPRELVANLTSELQMLAAGSSFYGTDILALELLASHGLSDRDWLLQWATFKRKRLQELLAHAQQIETSLVRGAQSS